MKKLRVFSIIAIMALLGYGIGHYRTNIESEIIIARPLDTVWQHFQCTQAYPQWNTLFYFAAFPTHQGQQLIIDLYNDDAQVWMTLQPEVISLRPYHLEWEGHLKFKGLFDGRHQFSFKAVDAHSTQLIHTEKFSGILVPWLKYFIVPATENRFKAMNNSFKAFVENSTLTNPCKSGG